MEAGPAESVLLLRSAANSGGARPRHKPKRPQCCEGLIALPTLRRRVVHACRARSDRASCRATAAAAAAEAAMAAAATAALTANAVRLQK